MSGHAIALSPPPPAPRSLWITLEAPEVIELKRIALDRDGDSAVAFFRDEVAPRVRRRMIYPAKPGCCSISTHPKQRFWGVVCLLQKRIMENR
jgi:hypothetical protein